MKTKLQAGAVLTTVEVSGTEYWRVGELRPTPPYFQNGNQVNGVARSYKAQGDDEIELGTVNEVLDNNGKTFKPLIGGRPRNILRR